MQKETRALQRLILACVFVAAFCQRNTFIKTKMTWSQARNYCMEHHNDLTSISSQNQDEDLPQHCGKAWIGLHKHENQEWKWAGGENATFFRWAPKGPDHFAETCVVHTVDGWRNNTCDDRHHFFCSNSSVVLVREKKTWEAAMEHCRDLNKSLVSLPSDAALQETLAAIEGTATARVWTGLRYLGDGWLWVSARPARHLEAAGHVKAPQCPGWTHRCGALSLHAEAVEGWDCADGLHFVCSKT